jgi:hypothetical protein
LKHDIPEFRRFSCFASKYLSIKYAAIATAATNKRKALTPTKPAELGLSLNRIIYILNKDTCTKHILKKEVLNMNLLITNSVKYNVM